MKTSSPPGPGHNTPEPQKLIPNGRSNIAPDSLKTILLALNPKIDL